MNNDERRVWIFLTIVAIGMAFLMGYLLNLAKPLKAGPIAAAASHRSMPAGSELRASSVPPAQSGTSDGDLPGALNRLQGAFRQHSGSSAKELIQQANANKPAGSTSPCPFQWNRDEEELVVRADQLGQSFMAKTVASCTKAIESLP